jgi:hypothetical protein
VTDREQIVAILDRAGVVFTTDDDPHAGGAPYGYKKAHAHASTLTVEQSREHERNIGYSGFMTIFYFNEAGALVCMGAWE